MNAKSNSCPDVKVYIVSYPHKADEHVYIESNPHYADKKAYRKVTIAVCTPPE